MDAARALTVLSTLSALKYTVRMDDSRPGCVRAGDLWPDDLKSDII